MNLVATDRSPLHLASCIRLSAWIGLLLALALDNRAAPPPAKPTPPPSVTAPAHHPVELLGQVVCLAEEMHRLHQTDLPTKHEHIYGFKATDGTFYTLLRTKWSEALFVDQRLHEKELLLKGRVLPKTQIFEVAVIRSVRNGVVCDLYYYCSICDIESVSPDSCACCQGPVELVEKPL